MTYADYTYYSGTYMGTVSEEDYPRLAVRASSFLDYYTQNRAKDNADMDAVKMCCCALVDKYQLIEAAQQLAATKLTNAATGDDGRRVLPDAGQRRGSCRVRTKRNRRCEETFGGDL